MAQQPNIRKIFFGSHFFFILFYLILCYVGPFWTTAINHAYGLKALFPATVQIGKVDLSTFRGIKRIYAK
jgi:hypothetical protein